MLATVAISVTPETVDTLPAMTAEPPVGGTKSPTADLRGELSKRVAEAIGVYRDIRQLLPEVGSAAIAASAGDVMSGFHTTAGVIKAHKEVQGLKTELPLVINTMLADVAQDNEISAKKVYEVFQQVRALSADDVPLVQIAELVRAAVSSERSAESIIEDFNKLRQDQDLSISDAASIVEVAARRCAKLDKVTDAYKEIKLACGSDTTVLFHLTDTVFTSGSSRDVEKVVQTYNQCRDLLSNLEEADMAGAAAVLTWTAQVRSVSAVEAAQAYRECLSQGFDDQYAAAFLVDGIFRKSGPIGEKDNLLQPFVRAWHADPTDMAIKVSLRDPFAESNPLSLPERPTLLQLEGPTKDLSNSNTADVNPPPPPEEEEWRKRAGREQEK